MTGWAVGPDAPLGWIGLVCPGEAAATWLRTAILAESVAAYRDGTTLFLPTGPGFRVGAEIKNLITAAAKNYRYWTKHGAFAGLLG